MEIFADREDSIVSIKVEDIMEKKGIYTESGPVAGSPYTPAVRVGDFVFVSGQIPLDPATSRIVEGDFEEQVRQCLRNLASVLKQEGLGLENVVKTTVFLKDLNDFSALNKVYAPYFSGVRPARSTLEVARLPLDVRVEIEAIAAT
jgi:2-iminobutanoate/2-iminopropanoate deaminase